MLTIARSSQAVEKKSQLLILVFCGSFPLLISKTPKYSFLVSMMTHAQSAQQKK
jgi:hypothetical protein